ncbi:MAG: aspartate kinase, partial [Alphaproteobacteria bacterium]|nr:aspartate kinase [Alphaproteobacteria bacterium]
MPTIVMKFGGTSVADLKRIENAAGKVAREIERGNSCAVVVSAMAGVTNQLVGWVNELNPEYDAREYDAVVATGEQVTAGLMALALQKKGIKARSWQGWQAGVISTTAHGRARIQDIEADRLEDAISKGEVPVIAGFQGVTTGGRITTLGRGGSDTSAVAFAAALNADRCDIYTDVDGVYTTDPRIVKEARKIDRISFEEMLEMASVGSKVLQIRSV